jgi:hypothetical protein
MLVALYAAPLLVIIIVWYTLGAAATARPFSDGLVNWLGRIVANIPIAGPLTAKMAVAMASWITNKLGAQWRNLEKMGVAWLSGLYGWVALPISQALMWPVYLFRLQSWLLTVEIPRLYHALARPAVNVTKTITKRLQPIERTIIKLPKLSRAAAKALVGAAVALYIHPYLADLRWLKRHFSALTHAIPKAIDLPTFPDFAGLRKRLDRLSKKVAPGALVGVIVLALAKMGLSWIRCNKVARIGKKVCGWDDEFIENLLLGATVVFGAASIVEFAETMRGVEDEAIGLMHKLVREWPS